MEAQEEGRCPSLADRRELERDPGLLPLVDPVDASVGAPEVAIAVVHLLVASDLAQELASGFSQFL